MGVITATEAKEKSEFMLNTNLSFLLLFGKILMLQS